MAAVADLCTLAQAKAWLGISDTGSDATLALLITAASRAILGQLNRQIFPGTITEYRDGPGRSKLMLSEWPVLSITSLADSGVAIQASTTPPMGSGYFLVPGQPQGAAGEMQALILCGGAWFCRGNANVVVTYRIGYVVQAEAWSIPTTPFQITPLAPFGQWNSDQGVTFSPSGVPLIPVPSAPAAGQYSVSAVGLYTFNTADAGKAVAISYGYTPAELTQACIESVGEWFSAKGRIGVNSKTLAGQETVSYSQKDLNNRVKMMLAPYQKVAPI